MATEINSLNKNPEEGRAENAGGWISNNKEACQPPSRRRTRAAK